MAWPAAPGQDAGEPLSQQRREQDRPR